jgi:hypothetical protein
MSTPMGLKSMVEKLLRTKVDKALQENARELYGGKSLDIPLESEAEAKYVQEEYNSFTAQVLRRYCCSIDTVPCSSRNCSHPTALSSSWIVRLQISQPSKF